MKSTLKYLLVLWALLLGVLTAQAQVKIGNNPTTINGGSLLELESTNKGLLMPRISLTNTTTWGLNGTPAAGMHVYNTNPGITSTNISYPTLVAKIGEYYWDGTGWVALAPVGTQDVPVQYSLFKETSQVLPWSGLNTPVRVDFTNKYYDKNNLFDLVTDSFTVPANGAGYYQINVNFGTAISIVPHGAFIWVFVNGVNRRVVAYGTTTANAGVGAGGSITIQLNVGDVVTFGAATSESTITQFMTLCDLDMYLISK